jgi:hypothetical protein
MDTLQNRISKINEEFDKKQATMLEKLAEERSMAIARETVKDTVENLKSMSMGNIISIFENISSEVLKTKGGKDRINSFISLVKEDKNIHNSYLLKENIFPAVNIGDPKEFINESIAIAKETSDEKSFKDSKKKLVKFVTESINAVSPEKISEKVKLDETVSRVNDNLETLMWSKRSIKNVANRTNSINETIDFITKKDTVSENKVDVFEHYKTECINTLSEAWENADAAVRMKLTEMKDRISKKMFSELTADDDIKYMKELIETVK